MRTASIRFVTDTKNNSVSVLTSAGGRVTTGIRSSTISRLLQSRESTIAIGLSRATTTCSVVSNAACTVDSAVFSPQLTSEFDFCTITGTKYSDTSANEDNSFRERNTLIPRLTKIIRSGNEIQ